METDVGLVRQARGGLNQITRTLRPGGSSGGRVVSPYHAIRMPIRRTHAVTFLWHFRVLCHFVRFIVASLSVTSAQPTPALATNGAPAITRLNPLNLTLPTIWIAGDSTAARGRGEMQQGWGVPFAEYFDPTRINIANRARGGRSSRTFINEGLWDQLITEGKAMGSDLDI